MKSKHTEDEVTLQTVCKKEMSLNHCTFYIQSVVTDSLEKYLCSLKDSVTTIRTSGQQSCYRNPSHPLSRHNVHKAFCSEAKGGRDLKPGRFPESKQAYVSQSDYQWSLLARFLTSLASLLLFRGLFHSSITLIFTLWFLKWALLLLTLFTASHQTDFSSDLHSVLN